ncbi:MAG TPA: tetratricopeptide repeat protein [Terriglobales bacterium]|nr:tetratricopeptide repeat protein [Terriglobales bacterium]
MGTRRAEAQSGEISEAFLSELRECLATRRIAQGLECLHSQVALIESLDPAQENAARFVGHLAQWVDVGAFDFPTLKSILRRFDNQTRANLTVRNYLYLRMAEGILAMSEEEIDAAVRHFDFVLGLPEELSDQQSLSIVFFWKARCLRRRGEYEKALIFAHQGRDTALALGFPRMAALSEVLESWLLFQKAKLKEAEQISQHAESVLRETDDHVTMGNIYSFYGRMARRAGRYDVAIDRFNQAISEYRQRDPQHPNLARSLANIALAKRSIALQLRRKIDKQAEKRRKDTGTKPVSSSAAEYRQRLEALQKEIVTHLEEASEIYSHHPNHHGIGTVRLNYSYVLLDDGDYDGAEIKAKEAYRLGEEKEDYILMGRARVVQCMIENARVEEEISEGTDPGSHARHALEYIREAIDRAKHTQNQRLLSNAYLWLGFTHCNTFYDDTDAAREAYDQAVAARKGAPPDNMWEDLQALKQKIVGAGSIDSKLKAWSQGSLGDKTFQQITEEFAELIIPRVWEREGRKVSRVASKLSISPKKVRRILDRVGRRKPN